MASSNQLGSVLETLVVLLEDLDEGLSFSGAQSAHKLNQVGRVRIIDGAVDVHADLVGPVDKLERERLQQVLLGHLILQGVIFQAQDLFVVVAQLGKLNQGILRQKKKTLITIILTSKTLKDPKFWPLQTEKPKIWTNFDIQNTKFDYWPLKHLNKTKFWSILTSNVKKIDLENT